MGLHHALNDGQPQPGTGRPAARIADAAAEGLLQPLGLGGVDAVALVGHLEPRALRAAARRDAHRRTPVSPGVLDEVGHRAAHRGGAQGHRGNVTQVEADVAAVVRIARGHVARHHVERGGHR